MLPRLMVVAVTPVSLAVLGLPFVVPVPWVVPPPPPPPAVPPPPLVVLLPPGPVAVPPLLLVPPELDEPGAPGTEPSPVLVPGPSPPFWAPLPEATKSLTGRRLPQAASTRQTPKIGRAHV